MLYEFYESSVWCTQLGKQATNKMYIDCASEKNCFLDV